MSTRLASGAMLGGYRIDGLLAEGGMGVVYRARQMQLDLPVALKVIRPEWAHDEDFRARFKREARLAASLHHPNVVSPHDFGDHEGQLFVVMPLIGGTDLGATIEGEGPLAPPRAADVIAQVAGALDVAHGSGLVHRDVKPGNVLLVRRDEREHAYLTDFGVARTIASETKITRLGQLPGTPGYVSPEQINGDALDARTDVYSLGCVLCEALTGSVPYPRQTPAAMLIAHMMDAPPRVSERMPSTPAGFDDVVSRALAKEPAERFGSAGELARAAQEAASASEPLAGRTRRRPAWTPKRRREEPASASPAPDRPPMEPALASPAPERPPIEPALASPEPKRQPEEPALASPEPGRQPEESALASPAAADGSGRRAGAIVIAGALGALVGAWAVYRIGETSSIDLYQYDHRLAVFAAFGAIFTASLAVAFGAARRSSSVRLLLTAAAGVWVGAIGGLLGALPHGWDSSPRRWLATIWLITGLVAGIGATVTGRDRRTILLATLLGGLGGGIGGLIARGLLETDEVLGNAGFGPFAASETIAGTCVGLGVALGVLIASRARGGTEIARPGPGH